MGDTATPEPPQDQPWLSANSLRSADIVVPAVLRFVRAQRVVDFGCKHGEWLTVFRRYGASTVLGFDQQIRAGRLIINRSEFRVADLNTPTSLAERFDLAVCIEVAEHLQESSAAPLVHTLTSVAPVVLFSAAIPGQGGHGHHNEQPRAYWHALFGEHGFRPIDCLRPQIWQDPRIAFWYRQNLIFYASAAGLEQYPALALEAQKEIASDLDLIHVAVLHPPSVAERIKAAVRRVVARRGR